jgi:hypothetical protein
LEFSLLDKSNYLKGLLIIARKDNQLAEQEKNILKNISEKLGFASDFYDETIKNLLYNKHINDEPIKFSSKRIAESFISDGLMLAFSDKKVHDPEIDWLKATAKENAIDENWFSNQMEKYGTESHSSIESNLTLYSII